MATATRAGPYLDRPTSSSLADVIDLILDKGLVIDAYVRVSLIGLELLTIDARVVVASVDTYLRFAEAVNRLDLTADGSRGLPELVQDGGAEHRSKGALEGAEENVTDAAGSRRGDAEDEEQPEERPRRRARPAARRREQE
ncbi:gas vesicle protein GvpJ [Kitasatospora sp. NPDC051914]|uniref:gas vesicle protein GvpJ n=1 Tax=Kitasatospora sp. NPDC051914 TaxID=3154945 RepID=UPI00342600AF